MTGSIDSSLSLVVGQLNWKVRLILHTASKGLGLLGVKPFDQHHYQARCLL